MDGFDREEDELQHQQGGRLYPVGRSLRSTFPPADGEDLQPRITSLMVELAHQPYESRPAQPLQSSQAAHPHSLLGHLTRLFRRSH